MLSLSFCLCLSLSASVILSPSVAFTLPFCHSVSLRPSFSILINIPPPLPGCWWWIDIKGGSPLPSLNILNTDAGTNTRLYLPSRVGTVVGVDGSPHALAACESGLLLVNPASGALRRLATHVIKDGEPLRMNDGKCDPQGRLWVGTMFGGDWVDNAGALWRVDGAGAATAAVPDTTISNGIVWSHDRRTMYYIDTPTLSVDAFDYDDATGAVTNRRSVCTFRADKADGLPDGMAIDIDGLLWVACFNGSQVVVVDPTAGAIVRRIPIPSPQVTSVAWGGPELATLFVTTGAEDLTPEQLADPRYQHAGACFMVTDTGSRGVPSFVFKPAAAGLDALLADGGAATPAPAAAETTKFVMEKVAVVDGADGK